MKILAKQNRELIMINPQNTQNENDAEKITLQVPEQYEEFNKKIVFVTPDGIVWDLIVNDEYLIKKAITKYQQVDFYIWLTKGDVDFRSQTKTLKFYHNVDASDEITNEETGRVNTVINLLEEEITKVENLESQVDGKLEEVDTAIDNINTAIQETENLNLDAEKVNNTTTVTLTKKNGTTKVVHVDDGVDLQFMWQGTSLGIKTAEQSEYTFVDLQGVQGPAGPQGEPFTIKKTYSSVAEMNADFNNMQLGDYVMIASTVEVEDNAKLYTRGESQWIFITDFSGATGIRGETGLTPNIQIGTVTQGTSFNVTRTGTNENPVLNFTLVKGDKGDIGQTGPVGPTGNGIASIRKTGTSGLVDTYTITYTNGNTTTFTITNGEDANTTEITNLKNENAYLQNVVKQAFTEKTASGTELTIDNTIEARMDLKLKGNTSQQQYSGKNLFSKNQWVTKTLNGITYTVNNDGTISANGTATNNAFYPFKKLLKAGTYTLSGSPNGAQQDKYTLQAQSYGVGDMGKGQTFTLIEETEVTFRLMVWRGNSVSNIIFTPQLEEGSTATDYEPYTGGIASPNPDYPQDIEVVTGDNKVTISNADNTKKQEFLINLGDIELCKIGDYQDYIYKKDDKWWKHKVIGKIVFDGTRTGWGFGTAVLENMNVANINIPSMLIQNFGLGFCNYFIRGTSTEINTLRFGANDSQLWFYVNATEFTNINDWKTWLSNNNITVYYVLATPIDEEIIDTTLIYQLDEISQALSKKGTTIIAQSNDDLPFNLDVIALTK